MTLFLFETTHHALWAEQLALEHGLAAQVVPAPDRAKAKCGLAIETLPEDHERMVETLDEAGVPFEIYANG